MRKLLLVSKVVLLFCLLPLGCHKDAADMEELQGVESGEINFRSNQVLVTGDGGLEELTPVLMVLGAARANPYTVENFTAAYNELYDPDITSLPITHYYVTLTPESHEQLVELAQSDLDIYDYPLDREVIQMGDYYIAPGKTESDLPQLWAVLKAGAIMPGGVSYQILANLHLNSADENLIRRALSRLGYNPDEEGYVIDTDEGDGEEGGSGSGGHGGSGLVLNSCGCQVFSDMRKPGGCIRVWDQQRLALEGVRRVTVRMKDSWFTSDEVLTDDNGCFRINKRYSGTAWLRIRFESPRGKVRASRVLNWPWLWAQPVTHRRTLAGPVFHNIQVEYNMWNQRGSDAHIYWGAATVNNALHEFRDLAITEGINPPPMGLDILVGRERRDGYALMRPGQNLMAGSVFALFMQSSYFAGPYGLLAAAIGWIAVKAYLPDVFVGIDLRNSDRLKNLAFHEIAHASHSTVVSGDYWRALVTNEINASIATGDPWGNAQFGGAGIIAVCESWAEHIADTFTDRVYGAQNSIPDDWLIRLEETRNARPDHVPIGFYHDLIDDVPDALNACDRVEHPNQCGPINDQVGGFTNAQLFGLLNDDILSPVAYRNRLLQMSNPAIHGAINDLFTSY